MGNAARALILIGGVLIGLIVISIGVYIFYSYSSNTETFDQNRVTAEIRKFNVNFTKFEERQDITIQEIVTLINFAQQYEEENEAHIQISIGIIPDIIDQLNGLEGAHLEHEKIKLIKENSGTIYKCQNLEYNNNDGKIYYIKFIEKT